VKPVQHAIIKIVRGNKKSFRDPPELAAFFVVSAASLIVLLGKDHHYLPLPEHQSAVCERFAWFRTEKCTTTVIAPKLSLEREGKMSLAWHNMQESRTRNERGKINNERKGKQRKKSLRANDPQVFLFLVFFASICPQRVARGLNNYTQFHRLQTEREKEKKLCKKGDQAKERGVSSALGQLYFFATRSTHGIF